MDPHDELGDFTLYGYAADIEGLTSCLTTRLNIVPKHFESVGAWTFFYYSSYADLAQNENSIVLKLGFLRSTDGSALSAKTLLNQKSVSPERIDYEAVRGDGLLVCASKDAPQMSVYKTLLAVPQCYYWTPDWGIICCDRLRVIVDILDRVEMAEETIPRHFLFRSVPGPHSYFKGVERLLPGAWLHWQDGRINSKLVKGFDFHGDGVHFTHGDKESKQYLNSVLDSVVEGCLSQIEDRGKTAATLLSGGVDSSLVQSLVNQHVTPQARHSYSFAALAPSFDFEIDYAQQASQFFGTQHTFVEFSGEDYVGLLLRCIETLAQPPILMTEPAMLAIAEYAGQRDDSETFFFSGQGADTVFGLELSKKLKVLQLYSRMPGSTRLLRLSGTLLRPLPSVARMANRGARMLEGVGDPDAYSSAVNSIAVYAEWDMLRCSFGDAVLQAELARRRDLAAAYLSTTHYLEAMHVVDLVTDTYELGVQRQQIFLANRKAKVHPFFDEDVLRAGFAFIPDARYIHGLKSKYVLKELLSQNVGYNVGRRPKGFSVFEEDWIDWMRAGPLRPLVEEIERPAFLDRNQFRSLLNRPGYFLWEILLLDLFKKRFV